jgi:tRNA 5-methylaminomethyl-2-thiouridine biosynthesis bifunctional protein
MAPAGGATSDPSDGEAPIAVPDPRGGGLFSPRYGDAYRGARGVEALAEAEHVFVEGNDLPARFARGGARTWTIGELGFGAGVSCVVTVAAFLRHAPAGARLHFVSAEKHLLPPDLLQLGLTPALTAGEPLVRQVAEALLEAFVRSEDEGDLLRMALPLGGGAGRLQVFVLRGDVADVFAERRGFLVDAWFLDLFAPDRQAGDWQVCRTLARYTAPGGTAATWSVAQSVRADLDAGGFEVERREGFGRKRAMTCARLRGGASPDIAGLVRAPARVDSRRPVVVRGASLAGLAVVDALRARGVEVSVCDPRGVPATPSAPPLLVLQPRLFDPNPVDGSAPAADARVVARAFDIAVARLRALGARQAAAGGSTDGVFVPCGVVHVSADAAAAERSRRRAACGAAGARYLDQDACAAAVGLPGIAPFGGVHLPDAGYVRTAELLAAWRLSIAASGAGPPGAGADGAVDLIATGAEAATDPRLAGLPIHPVRGHLSISRPTDSSSALGAWPRAVLSGGGHLTPLDPVLGCRAYGATFDRGAGTPATGDARALRADDARNQARLRAGLPASEARTAMLAMLARERLDDGWVGWRATTPDHLPYAGAVGVIDEVGSVRFPAEGPLVATGLGSRGAALAFLCAEIVAAEWCGEPAVLPDRLLEHVLPARALLRTARRLR